MGKIYQHALGIEVRLNTKQDLSTATALEIHVYRPDETETIWPAAQYGATQIVVYVTDVGDLDQIGKYRLQAFGRWGQRSEHLGETVILEVFPKYDLK